MIRFARPNLTDIHNLLRKRNELIVHFSRTQKGAGSDFEDGFPNDLTQVIGGGGLSGLATFVVMPGYEFTDVSRTNATGCIGVILALQSFRCIADAHPRDFGSFLDGGVGRVPLARDMTIGDVEATVTNRRSDDYNQDVFGRVGGFGAIHVHVHVHALAALHSISRHGSPTSSRFSAGNSPDG